MEFQKRPTQQYHLLDAPLVFNIEEDPGEEYPLNATDPAPSNRLEYKVALAAATAVAEKHASTFEWYSGGPLLNVRQLAVLCLRVGLLKGLLS